MTVRGEANVGFVNWVGNQLKIADRDLNEYVDHHRLAWIIYGPDANIAPANIGGGAGST